MIDDQKEYVATARILSSKSLVPVDEGSKEHHHIQFLRERSLWTDVKGRKLLVLRHYFAWNGAAHVISSLELVLLDELAVITRPRAELAALITDGRMKYDGELTVKVPVAVPSGVVAQLTGAEN